MSGNPGGRPKKTAEEAAVVKAARAKSKQALDVVVDIMNNGSSERVRLSAALAVIERGCGKPGEVLSSPMPLAEGGDVAAQARAVLASAIQGELPVPQASALLSALGTLTKIVETQELAARVAALEKANAGKP
jgi:hypothetical protein